MEEFTKSLFEIYMNYDTLKYLKEEKETNENIIEMFKDELDYSQDLTSTLLKYDKTFLKSIAMRIKIKMKKNLNNDLIKGELLTYDSDLSPLLEKLLKSNNFKTQYELINEDTEIVEEEALSYGNDLEVNEGNYGFNENDNNEEEEEEIEEEEIEDDSEDIKSKSTEKKIDIFLDTLIKTNNNSDTLKISELYSAYCNFCDDKNIDKPNKSEFKEYIVSKWGKCPKNGFEGYKL